VSLVKYLFGHNSLPVFPRVSLLLASVYSINPQVGNNWASRDLEYSISLEAQLSPTWGFILWTDANKRKSDDGDDDDINNHDNNGVDNHDNNNDNNDDEDHDDDEDVDNNDNNDDDDHDDV
jgi:hypothetical protein